MIFLKLFPSLVSRYVIIMSVYSSLTLLMIYHIRDEYTNTWLKTWRSQFAKEVDTVFIIHEISLFFS